MSDSGLDIFLDSASKIASQLLPIVGVIVLIVLIIFIRKLTDTMRKVDDLIKDGEKIADSTKRQIDALDTPMRTISEVSSTIDFVHHSSKSAIKSAVGAVAAGFANFSEKRETEKQQKDDNDEVVATMDINNDSIVSEEIIITKKEGDEVNE